MEPFYLGIDVSKGYADFMIINSKRQPVAQAFHWDEGPEKGGQTCNSPVPRLKEDHAGITENDPFCRYGKYRWL